MLSESVVALYVGVPQKQNGRQYNAMESDRCKHTNKQDLTFQNHPEVVSNDFLGDLCL